MRKRILSLLIVLSLCLGLLPVTALAAGEVHFGWAGHKLQREAIGKQLLKETLKLVVKMTTMSITMATEP